MAGIWMVTHKYVNLNQEVRNVFYYEEQQGTPTNSEWQDIADEIRGDWVSDLQSHCHQSYVFYGIDYRQVDVAGLPSFTKSFTAGPALGTDAGNEMATQLAMVVSVKGNTTKPNRARSYLSGWIDGKLTNGLFESTPIADAESFIDFQSVLNAAGTNDLQRVSAQWNTSHTQVIVTNNIAGSAAVAAAIPGTQRSRRIGVGI